MKKFLFVFTAFIAFCFVNSSIIYAVKCEYVKEDEVKVDTNGYIMSWLFLDPYINDGKDAGIACNKDYFEDQGGEAKLKPKEGDKAKIKETESEHVWTRVNLLDLKEMGQITAAVGGNELDIICWGGQGPTNVQEYLVVYLKWKSDTTATFTVGVDDAVEVYFNGELIISDPNSSQNWGDGNAGVAEVNATGGEWNVLVVGCYETGGEWGLTVRVDPIPDEVNNAGPASIFAVGSVSKLTTTWGKLKINL